MISLLSYNYSFSCRFPKIFFGNVVFCLHYYDISLNRKTLSSWDNSEKEYISVYATPIQDQLYFECITNGELIEESFELKKLDEIVAEQIFETEDLSATVKTVTKNCKVRKMNRAIGDGLKQLYGYRCQICGAFIGEKYGSSLIHAHHIEYFTKSMNNDASNVLPKFLPARATSSMRARRKRQPPSFASRKCALK